MYIWGNGELARVALDYWLYEPSIWSSHGFIDQAVRSFIVDADYKTNETYLRLPVQESSYLLTLPDGHIFLPIGYKKANKIREEKFNWIRSFTKLDVISHTHYLSHVAHSAKFGIGNWIQEYVNIQSGCRIGDNNIFWGGGVHIGHGSEIGSHNFISTGAVVSGNCKINNNCFLGVNSSVKDGIELPEGTTLGQGAIITKTPKESYQVFLAGVNNLYHKSALEI